MPLIGKAMRRLMMPTIAVVAVVGLIGCGATPTATRAATGKTVRPLQASAGDVVVLLFSSPDCPIANAIGPEIERLHTQTVNAGGQFYVVHARDDVTAAGALQHAKAYGISAPILLDPDHRLVQAVSATVTPEIVVVRFDSSGRKSIVYQGLVNNLYASLGNRRDAATEHYGRDAIDLAAAGETVASPYRAPIGCYIERAP